MLATSSCKTNTGDSGGCSASERSWDKLSWDAFNFLVGYVISCDDALGRFPGEGDGVGGQGGKADICWWADHWLS